MSTVGQSRITGVRSGSEWPKTEALSSEYFWRGLWERREIIRESHQGSLSSRFSVSRTAVVPLRMKDQAP